MDADFAARAEARRRTWQVSVVTHEEADAADLAFWRSFSPSDRWNAVWQMAQEAWEIKGSGGPFPRLQGSPFGVRRVHGNP